MAKNFLIFTLCICNMFNHFESIKIIEIFTCSFSEKLAKKRENSCHINQKRTWSLNSAVTRQKNREISLTMVIFLSTVVQFTSICIIGRIILRLRYGFTRRGRRRRLLKATPMLKGRGRGHQVHAQG